MSDHYKLTDEEFIRLVKYYWNNKQDPTRFIGWNQERCMRIFPQFYRAWIDYKIALTWINSVTDNENEDVV